MPPVSEDGIPIQKNCDSDPLTYEERTKKSLSVTIKTRRYVRCIFFFRIYNVELIEILFTFNLCSELYSVTIFKVKHEWGISSKFINLYLEQWREKENCMYVFALVRKKIIYPGIKSKLYDIHHMSVSGVISSHCLIRSVPFFIFSSFPRRRRPSNT